MSDIPIEIFRELILKYVPVESLFRFRSVCKAWRQIIDDPSFVKKHINHGIGQGWFFHRHEKGNIFLLPVNELATSESYIKRINATSIQQNLIGPNFPDLPDFPVPCCNGLVLISSWDNNLVWRIWNPFTGESLEIKLCRDFANVKYKEGDYPICGIGYDGVNDDYKVVRIVKQFTCVYSLNSEKWRRIVGFPDYLNVMVGSENGVFVYGALHWVSHSMNNGWVIAFDLSTEKYRKFPLPPEITQRDPRCLLTALNGCLFLTCHRLRGFFIMWMLKDYGGEDTWDKMVSVEVDHHMVTTPLTYSMSKEMVLVHRRKLPPYRYDGYLWYRLGKKHSKRLGIEVSTDGTDDEWEAALQYIFSSFTSQVLPANLTRLKRSDCSDEGVMSRRTPKRKRKGAVVIERLPLKIMFGERGDWTRRRGV